MNEEFGKLGRTWWVAVLLIVASSVMLGLNAIDMERKENTVGP